MRNSGRLILRRAFAVSVIAVALSAAGALAFAPNFSRVTRVWSHGVAWSARAFTPVPVAHDSSAASHDPSLENEALPGTYCPIRPHEPNTSIAAPDGRLSTEAVSASNASTPVSSKTDVLTPLAPAMCNPSAADTTRATAARRSLP